MRGGHGVKSHIAQLIGIGGAIFVGLLPTGRLASESLYLAAVLSCPLMRIGMLVTMLGHQDDHVHPGDDSEQGAVTTDPESAEAAPDHGLP